MDLQPIDLPGGATPAPSAPRGPAAERAGGAPDGAGREDEEAEGSGPDPAPGGGGLLAMIALSRAAMAPPPAHPEPAAAAPSPAGPIEPVTVERHLSVTQLFGRRDVVLRARIASSPPVEEVTVTAGGAVMGQMLLPAAPGGPGGPAAARCLAMQVALPADMPDGGFAFQVSARGGDGRPLDAGGRITLEGDGRRRASVLGLPVTPAEPARDFAPEVMLYVERATVDPDGMLLVHGWSLGRSPVAAVQILADGANVGAARIGLHRPDVSAIFPSYAGSALAGFRFAARLGEAGRRVTHVAVQAITQGGASQTAVLSAEHAESASRAAPTCLPAPDARTSLSIPPPEESRRVQMFCNRAGVGADGRLTVAGWAYCPAGIAGASLRLGGVTLDGTDEDAPPSPLAEIRWQGALPPGVELPATLTASAESDGGEAAELQVAVSPPDGLAEDDLLAEEPEFWFELDAPAPLGTGAPIRVGSALDLRGWALASAGVDRIEVLLDGVSLGEAETGLARPDVQAAHPGQDARDSGFSFACGLRQTPNGEHALLLRVHDRAGKAFERAATLLVEKPYAILRTRLTLAEESLGRDVAARLGADAAVMLVLRQTRPSGDAEAARLGRTLASLRAQTHARWHLTIVADDPHAARAWLGWVAGAHPDLTPRITVTEAGDPRAVDRPAMFGDGLALTASPAGLVGVLGAGDALACDALAEIAATHALHPDADLLYADDIRLSPASGAAEPFLKPGWSPELLLSANYVGRPWFATPALIDRNRSSGEHDSLGGFLRLGEYDALLRASERARAVRHVPRLLCEMDPEGAEPPESEMAALEAASARRGFASAATPGEVPGSYRLRRAAPHSALVSVIVPTMGARHLVEDCILSLRKATSYRNIEIVAIDTIPDRQAGLKTWLAEQADHVVAASGPFNWSRLNNEGARRARGDHLLFLNDDVSALHPDWLDALLDVAARPEVGVVGPRLLYPDGTVQHAGMFLARPGLARHAFRSLDRDAAGYFGLARTQRDVAAVTGACMLMRREVFDRLGGFDEAHAVINNDLDFCLRVREAGWRVVFTPHATLTHQEGASRKELPEAYGAAAFDRRWGATFAAGDPFHNQGLSRETDDLEPDEEPVRAVRAGHPLFRHADIGRILAVKLDHIGDVVTARPALRLLRERFPRARITLLAGSYARALAEGEPSVDAFVGFDFYNARSQDGQAKLTPGDYAALRERLAPHRFDLAIDLRKHPDTRDVLRHVPARLLAGFDQGGRFPFLDVALEWAADRPLQTKRAHVSDDLANLVDAICRAGRPEEPPAPLPAPDLALVRAMLPPDAARLWDRPVVAIHPGVGNVMRQWPERHFADLAELFIERSGASVALIGTAEDAAAADGILARLSRPERAASLAGLTSLSGLERLLPQFALYVGNNSGPHHMAAALGVPTVGIHSGVVDPAEWAPVGPRAVALARRMTCGPCYLATPEQCHRGLACLTGLSPAVVHRHGEMLMARRPGSNPRAPT